MAVHVLFDLDKTLAVYDGWKGEDHIGEPTPLIYLVKDYLSKGIECKIFTARASHDNPENQIKIIKEWCKKHFGQELEVCNYKTYETICIYDDIAFQVQKNTGKITSKNTNDIQIEY